MKTDFWKLCNFYRNCPAVSRFSDQPWDLEVKSWDHALTAQTVRVGSSATVSQKSDSNLMVLLQWWWYVDNSHVSVKSNLQYPGHLTPLPSRRGGNLIIRVFQVGGGGGIWSPCIRGREFELHPRLHVKSLVWRAIMGGAVLEDFCGKDCSFVANLLQGKGLNKLCAVF